jgi:hypothetical protein
MAGGLRPSTGHVFRVERGHGPVWYAKYRLSGGRQVQKKLGSAESGTEGRSARAAFRGKLRTGAGGGGSVRSGLHCCCAMLRVTGFATLYVVECEARVRGIRIDRGDWSARLNRQGTLAEDLDQACTLR